MERPQDLESEDMGYNPPSGNITQTNFSQSSFIYKMEVTTAPTCQAGCEEQKLSEWVVKYLACSQDSMGMQGESIRVISISIYSSQPLSISIYTVIYYIIVHNI